MKRNCRGMTLLELLVAVAVFAVLAVIAYGGLEAVLNTSRAAQDEATRLAELQRALSRIDADIEQMAQREVRDNYGDSLEAVRIEQDASAATRLEFTRRGYRNLTGQRRSNLQRIAYSLRDGSLVRESWAVLDRAQDTQAYRAELLRGVTRFSVTLVREPEAAAVPAGTTPITTLPRAVEIIFEHEKWGRIRRLIKVAA